MRHVPLVIAAFETLSEAEAAVESVLDTGFRADVIRAAGRAGGGRLLLAGRVAVQPVGQPAKLADRAERAGGAALLGAVVGAVVAAGGALLLRLLNADPLAPLRGALSGPLLFWGAIVLCALLGAAVGVGALRSSGLPHDLALRYSRRLEDGDVVLGVTTADSRQARSVQESLAIHGATLTHVTRGEMESVGEPSTPGSEEPLTP
jgi:hypothetical protein